MRVIFRVFGIWALAAFLPVCAWASGDSLLQAMEKVWAEMPKDEVLVDSMLNFSTDRPGIRKEPVLSIRIAQMAERLADSLNLPKRISRALTQQSDAFYSLGLYTQSLEVLERNMELQRGFENRRGLAWSYNRMGLIYQKINAWELSRKYFKKAEREFSKMGDEVTATFPLVNLAAMLHDKGEVDSARMVLTDILAQNEEGEIVKGRDFAILNNLGNLYKEMGQYDKAEEYFLKSLEVKYAENRLYSAANTLDNLVELYTLKGQLDLAQSYLDSTRTLAEKENAQEYLLSSLNTGAKLHFKQGKYALAYRELRDFYEKTDSIQTLEQATRVSDMMLVMDASQQNAEIQLLEKDNQLMNANTRQKNLVIIGLGLGLLLVVVVGAARWRFTQQLRKANEDLRTKSDQIIAQKDEIAAQKASLEKKNEELELAIQEKDGLIGFVAHDLKAPVNKTIGLLNMLDKVGNDKEKARQVTDLLNKVNQNALELINDLLLISEVEGSEEVVPLEPTNLKSLVATAAGEFGHLATQKSIHLELNLPDEVVVDTHPKSISRILDNFVSNAIKYSPNGSQVELGLTREEGLIRLYVKDQGPGISQEDQEKMFRKFQKLTARPTGGESSHGLGLAIAKSLADRIGVQIGCNSHQGEGSTFFIGFLAA